MKVEILGVKVNGHTYQEALQEARRLVESEGKHYIVTPNPEMIVMAQKDLKFKDILNSADLSIPDGAGLVWLARYLGKVLPERVAGVDFLEGLAALGEEHGFSLFLLGGGSGVAERAAQVLKGRYPKLNVAGTFSGRADVGFDKKTKLELKDKKIDILAVSYGAPKQEKWITRNLPHLNVKLAIGVGGALDYISGAKRRAPTWVQKANLEWLFRLVTQPTRFKRQLALPAFIYLVLKEKLKGQN